jgi:hypothetical protein
MPVCLAAISEKSRTRAMLLLAASGVLTLIQKVIVKLVELKYVPDGSVIKLTYFVLSLLVSLLPPLM